MTLGHYNCDQNRPQIYWGRNSNAPKADQYSDQSRQLTFGGDLTIMNVEVLVGRPLGDDVSGGVTISLMWKAGRSGICDNGRLGCCQYLFE
jgi:hypothetical protein